MATLTSNISDYEGMYVGDRTPTATNFKSFIVKNGKTWRITDVKQVAGNPADWSQVKYAINDPIVSTWPFGGAFADMPAPASLAAAPATAAPDSSASSASASAPAASSSTSQTVVPLTTMQKIASKPVFLFAAAAGIASLFYVWKKRPLKLHAVLITSGAIVIGGLIGYVVVSKKTAS